MSTGTGLFVSRNDYSGHQNIPWPETHVIPTKFDRRQKIIMVFLAAQCSKFKTSFVLDVPVRNLHPSMADLYHVITILQRAHCDLKYSKNVIG